MTTVVTLSQLLQETRLSAAVAAAKESRLHYYSIASGLGRPIMVESTAHKVMDALARFTIDDQVKVFDRLRRLAGSGVSGTTLLLKDDIISRERAYVTLSSGLSIDARMLLTR